MSGISFDNFNIWRFIWVGPLLSLPIPLLIARAFGAHAYRDYWTYLESFPHNSKTGIQLTWAAVVAFTFGCRDRIELDEPATRGSNVRNGWKPDIYLRRPMPVSKTRKAMLACQCNQSV